jgi:hypothetical protein
MTSYKNSPALRDEMNFDEVLDRACEGLWDKKIQFSIRRLREMDAALLIMEKELDILIDRKTT